MSEGQLRRRKRRALRRRLRSGGEGSRVHYMLERLKVGSATRRGAFNIHLAAFVSVNAFLMFLDFVTGGGVWFPYVLGGWSIPMFQHYIHVKRRNGLQKKLEERPDLPDRMFGPVRRLHRSMTHYMMGAGLAANVSAYLAMINVMTGGSPWWLIPAASMALPVVFHTLILRARRAHLLQQIESGGEPLDLLDEEHEEVIRGGRLLPHAAAPEYSGEHPALADARHIAEEITRLIDLSGPKQAELAANVDEMISEIERLCELQREFEAAANLISIAELERDRALLRKRNSDDAAPALKRQYESTIKQLDRQIESHRELRHRKELLDLRIRTAVNSLRQINVDLVRLKGDAALQDVNALLQQKTDELSTYLADLQQSYDELSDEFGE